jgi:hypothetical protein
MEISRVFHRISKMTTRFLLNREKREKVKEEGFVRHKPPVSELFGSRRYIHRRELREFFKKVPKKIPEGRKLPREELVSMEKEIFPEKRFGEYITVSEFKKALRELKKAKRRATKPSQRAKVRTKIKLLERLVPKKDEK